MGQRQTHRLHGQICQELFVRASIDTVYYYVTQPDRWPEWQPSSLSADTGRGGSLPAGHRFSEVMDLLGVQIPMSYRVLVAVFPKEFKALFSSAALDGSIRYQWRRQGDGTLLRRTLEYATELQLGGLHTRMEQLSSQALGNLKRRLEPPSD